MVHRAFWFLTLLLMAAAPSHASEVDVLYTRALENMPEDPEVRMLTVSYRPGEASEPHRHNANVFVYVLEGTVQMKVKGGATVTLSPGDTFQETPDDVHVLSANTSDTEPAKFLVFFIKEKGAPATILE